MMKKIIYISIFIFVCLVFSKVYVLNFAKKEHEFVIVIPSYNNKNWYQKNLDSVIHQNYSNYKIIYIDDCSPDGTGDYVNAHGQEQIKDGRLILVKNKTRKLALANLYDAIQTISPQAIVVILDGDDWLPNNDVLSYLNKVYSENDIWLTFGQYKEFPGNRRGLCEALPDEIIAKNAFREYKWVTSHLRTFYAGLFHKIKKEDLTYNGEFFPMTYDMAIMFPMLEMAGSHIGYISEILYIYNVQNPIADWRVNSDLQHSIDRYIRSLKKYDKLASLF